MHLHPDDVLDVLRKTGRTIHLTELARALDLPPKQLATLERALDALADAGLAKAMPGSRFRATKAQGSLRSRAKTPPPADRDVRRPSRAEERPRGHERPRTSERAREREQPRTEERPRFTAPPRTVPTHAVGRGRIIVHPRGFAFVAVGDGGPDVFITDAELGPALHGDEVEVEMRPSTRGREGTVIGIVDRREPRITGSLRVVRDTVLFDPDDPRLRRPMAVEGPLPIEPQSGDAYVAEIVRFPQTTTDRAAVTIAEKLGPQGETRTEIAKIIVREGVEESFGPSVLAEAKLVPKRVSPAEHEGREDIRELDLVTIDPDDARDHDDALFAERVGDGYRLVIAIADVSHYVREGTAIDTEAQSRGTSIYLPTHAIPMLPHEISSRIASLVPNEDRLCLVVEVELHPDARIKQYRLFEGVMRSHARLTYGQAAKALGLTSEGKRSKDAEARRPMLEVMLEVSRLLRKRRMKRGALDFDLPEPKLTFEDGEPKDVVRSRKDPGVREAYRLVEEMMLLANEIVAAELTRKNVPGIYRIHGKPDERKLELFCRLATSLGHDIDIDEALDPRTLARFVDKLGEAPESAVLRYLLLRAMQQASYDPSPDVGHFGLAAPDYLHFTSPIRRYPDLAVHRIVRSLVRGERLDAARLRTKHRKQATDSSRLERRAMSVERDVLDLYRALLMRDRIGEELPGVLTSIDVEGFSVTLDAPFVEVRVDLDALPYDRLTLDDLGVRLTNRAGFGYALGDRVTVRIQEIDLGARTVRGVPVVAPVSVRDDAGGEAARPGRRGRTRPEPRAERRPESGGDARPARETKPKKHVVVSRQEARAQTRGEAPDERDGEETPAPRTPFDREAWLARKKQQKAARGDRQRRGDRKRGKGGR